MSDISETKRCPKCGSPIADDAPQGLCPKCVLAQASIPTEGAKGQTAPSPEEVAAAFPQLEILELIGQGGMGFVFKARQTKLERLVALKILPQALAADPAFAERFTREGRVLARLNHPNIVAIHDFGQAGNFFYLLMEYVDGVNLRQAMRAGRFTPAQALAVVPKICEALQFAHDEGILHRDIKPENILVDVRGRVKIADFGIAKLLEDAKPGMTLTGSGATLGTPHYMAPEQLEKPGTVDHRADIYSLGVVFYEMLTGELPLGRFQPPSQKVEMDVRLDEVVLHALEKEPARRYQQASQVKTAVETIASGAASAAAAAPVGSPDPNSKRISMAMILVPGAYLLFLILVETFVGINKNLWLGVGLAVYLYLLLSLYAWKDLLKKTEIGTMASGTADGAPVSQAPVSDRFWRRMTMATGGVCVVLIALVFFFARELHLTNQRGDADEPSWWADVPAETRAYVAAQKALATVPQVPPPVFLPEGGAEKEDAQLVIDSVAAPQPSLAESNRQNIGLMRWDFKYLIPSDHLAQIVFVQWDNGVPWIKPGLSGYFKVGEKPVNLETMCIFFQPLGEAHSLEKNETLFYETQWHVSLGFGYTNGAAIKSQFPFRKLETAPRYVLHSGQQLAIRLAEYDPPAGAASNGWSGVEVRLILQPLPSPAMQTYPSEVVSDNYVAGWGFDAKSDDAILKMIMELPVEGQPVEKNP